ncbi:DHH family phosphoesterase [Dethiobacter alkaliphilus]|uniref:DHH family phosphoesterase n=1 Tax=Dethiobacter alkaliphilus TaxID=427926 RepID=UPI002225D2F8|nr:bifunctional oligoribonuclease/PAP phosphatase NrnA [Dethiobacter alkaliphilus]MCW3490840.1 bifunctional oligoribonuclease/PAP phosphatase NrnA [Dethiobacter alkaliphilus]
MSSLQEIAARLKPAKNILLTTHIQPDGDAIGSLLGLGYALLQLGRNVTLFSADPVPKRFCFLTGAELIVSGELPGADFDCVVTLDCSDQDRVAPVWEQIKERIIINIDHHPTNNLFGRINYVDEKASATGEIVYELLSVLEAPLDPAVAAALYVAISTDTGSFKYENTTARTHRVIAHLLEAGASPREITPRVFDLRSRTAVCVLREALNSLEFNADGKVAWMALTEKEIKLCGAGDEDLDGIVNYAKNIQGVDVGLFFREKADQTVKVGLRSHNADVGKVAQALGGGGHARAAGCSLDMKLADARKTVLAAVEQEV